LAEGRLGVFHRFVHGRADVEVKRLTDGTWLFGPVEHGD